MYFALTLTLTTELLANLFAGVQMVLVSLSSFNENVIAPIATLHCQGCRYTNTLARILALRERCGLLKLAVVGDPVLEK